MYLHGCMTPFTDNEKTTLGCKSAWQEAQLGHWWCIVEFAQTGFCYMGAHPAKTQALWQEYAAQIPIQTWTYSSQRTCSLLGEHQLINHQSAVELTKILVWSEWSVRLTPLLEIIRNSQFYLRRQFNALPQCFQFSFESSPARSSIHLEHGHQLDTRQAQSVWSPSSRSVSRLSQTSDVRFDSVFGHSPCNISNALKFHHHRSS